MSNTNRERPTDAIAGRGVTTRRRAIAAAGLSLAGLGATGAGAAARQPDGDLEDLEVIARLLAAEREAYDLFRVGLRQFTSDEVTSGDRLLATQPTLALIWQHERSHLSLLTDVAADLGGDSRPGSTTGFTLPDLRSVSRPSASTEVPFPDFATFLQRAADLKRQQVADYMTAVSTLEDADLRALAAQILIVEAQHAFYLNERTGQDRFWSES